MNYINWAAEYEEQNQKVLQCIQRAKAQLKDLTAVDDIKSVQRRIAVLRSIYKQNKLTAEFLTNRGRRYGDHITEKPIVSEVHHYGKEMSA